MQFDALHAGRVLEAAAADVNVDIMMPIVDGLTVCRRLRAVGNWAPVRMLTVRDEVGDRVRGLRRPGSHRDLRRARRPRHRRDPAAPQRPRLGRRDHVVGDGGDVRRALAPGSKRLEWSESCHVACPRSRGDCMRAAPTSRL